MLTTMETTVNTRIVQLKEKLGLTNQEFVTEAKIASGTLWNIENGGNVSPKIIKLISLAFNVNPEWLRIGKGKMFKDVVMAEPDNPWKDEAYLRLKSDMDYLKEQYSKILNRLLDGGNLGKSEAFNFTEKKQAA